MQVVVPGSNDVSTRSPFNVNEFMSTLSATHQISVSNNNAWTKNLNGDTPSDSASTTQKTTSSRDAASSRIPSKSPTNQPKSPFGHASRLIETAEKLSKHVIVFGNPKCFDIFVHELRRDLICAYSYRPIVYVGDTTPEAWLEISSQYDDIYWLRGDMTKSSDFNHSNVRSASAGIFPVPFPLSHPLSHLFLSLTRSLSLNLIHSYSHCIVVVLLADRDKLATVDDENLDATNLFAYLLLEKHMPLHVFFTAEVTYRVR